jgi:hypothetical protein
MTQVIANMDEEVRRVYTMNWIIPSIKKRVFAKKIQNWYSNYVIEGYFSKTIWRDWDDAAWETKCYAYDKAGRIYNAVIIPSEDTELMLRVSGKSIELNDIIQERGFGYDGRAVYYKIGIKEQLEVIIPNVDEISMEDIRNTKFYDDNANYPINDYTLFST